MATTVTVKGQVTIPKRVRQAAGISPGDRVNVRALPNGGVAIEREGAPGADEVADARRRLDAALELLDRRGVRFSMSTEEWLNMTRGDD